MPAAEGQFLQTSFGVGGRCMAALHKPGPIQNRFEFVGKSGVAALPFRINDRARKTIQVALGTVGDSTHDALEDVCVHSTPACIMVSSVGSSRRPGHLP